MVRVTDFLLLATRRYMPTLPPRTKVNPIPPKDTGKPSPNSYVFGQVSQTIVLFQVQALGYDLG